MSSNSPHYSVVRNGKLTPRIQKILDKYKTEEHVDVVRVIESECKRLEGIILTTEVFETTYGQEPLEVCKAKLKALQEILNCYQPVINS